MIARCREFTLALLVGLACACACRGHARSESRGPAVQPSAHALSGLKGPALERCVAAREGAQEALDAGGDLGQAFGSVTTACADLYSEPRCASAFRAAAALPPASRAASIALACRVAYCPKLTPPQPALCASDEPQLPSHLLATWPELDTRILSLELNVSLEEVERLLPRPAPPAVNLEVPHAVVSVSSSDTNAGDSASVVIVSLGVDASGKVRTWVDGDPPEVLPARPDAANLASVAARIKKLGATRVAIAADKRATNSQVVALIDALKQVGITHIALQVVPTSDPQNGAR